MKTWAAKHLNPTAIAVVSLALGGCAGTTYGTGKSPGAQTVEDIVGIVDFSSGKSNKDPIDYKPRPPVVVPPSTASLPPPIEPGTSTAANWPRDPDELERQRRAAAAAAAAGAETPTAAALADPGFRLPKQEETRTNYNRGTDNPSMETTMTQQERQQAKKIFADAKAGTAAVDENGIPIRTTLTEPPSEYRIPDPEAPDEFTTNDGKKKKGIWPFR